MKNHIPIARHFVPSPDLTSPVDDEFSTVISKRTPPKEKFLPDLQDDSHPSESSYGKYRTNQSITSSSSPSTNSHDEPPLTPDTLLIGRVYLIDEIYPSLESENLKETPLAFLGSEKFLHIRIDWSKVRYPLSSHYVEIIIDLILTRPSFIREIPKVTQLNIYRPLIQTLSG